MSNHRGSTGDLSAYSTEALDALVRGCTTDELYDYVQYLQHYIENGSGFMEHHPPYRYQELYRIIADRRHDHFGEAASHYGVDSDRVTELFLDPPRWIEGQNGSGTYQSSVPVQNFELFLERNKDISFLVLHTYSQPPVANAQTTSSRQPAESTPPARVKQSIRPVDPRLFEAMKEALESRGLYAQTLRSFVSTGELSAPYHFVFHHFDELRTRPSSSRGAHEQLELLLDYINARHGEEYQAVLDLLSKSQITPRYMDYLIKPGDILVQNINDHYRGFVASGWIRKEASESEKGPIQKWAHGVQNLSRRYATGDDKSLCSKWSVEAWSWEFDGKFEVKHGPLPFGIPSTPPHQDTDAFRLTGSTIDPDEALLISSMSVFPIQFLSPDIVQSLQKQGETFWSCRDRRYVSYRGPDQDGSSQVEERYMIDQTTYNELHGDGPPRLLRDEESFKKDEPAPEYPFLLLLPLKIKGYNLRLKKWYDLDVDRITDVHWNEGAFSKVVMNSKAKDMIHALLSRQLAAEKSTDLIAGKGNGLILLLHGGPGTGKTLTAESVAEIAKKPLYRVTCGDVGTKAEAVEKYLESVFDLGKRWGCVVLLDEADVFLEQRSLADLKRNALVSVFLRVLEYYEGILVLTSNRVGTFDEAFKSRIQLALHYPTLGQFQRLCIWQNFVEHLKAMDDESIDFGDLEDHLEELSQEKMNGRQIRNALTTARQYALWKEKVLTYEHLKDVIEVSGRFDKYLEKLHGGLTEDQLAEEEGIRAAE